MSMSTKESGIDLRELGPSAAEPFDDDHVVGHAPVSVPSDGAVQLEQLRTTSR